MPLAQQFLARALTSGPSDIAFDSSIGAAQAAIGGGSMGAVMSAANDAARSSVNDIKADPGRFVCGALRVAIERTPVFGPVFRLGESALGQRMCEKDEMTVAERQSLARGAAVDLVAPGASLAMTAVEMGVSKPMRFMLESMSPGITQTSGYKAYASVLRADDPDRETLLAAEAAAKATASVSTQALAEAEPAQAARAERVEPKISAAAPSMDAGEGIALGAIADKLAARRAAKLGSVPEQAPAQPSFLSAARM